ncbi:MAG: hypothetical protein IH944_08255 [Armatimonadetes bacterium]|nr:hypothetical protein [Armatimonadota bacterium]
MAKSWLDGEYLLRSTVACVTCVVPVIFFYAWLAFDQLAHAEMWVRLLVMGVGIIDGGAMWALATHWWRFADRNCAGVLSAVFAVALFPRLLEAEAFTLQYWAVVLASVVAGYVLGYVGHWLVVQIQNDRGQLVTD